MRRRWLPVRACIETAGSLLMLVVLVAHTTVPSPRCSVTLPSSCRTSILAPECSVPVAQRATFRGRSVTYTE
ncbi:hypothetical protein [Nocardia sp. BMG111209]|uniref:hypothetical protein n=1 Tax=Nocardia sp. BMG111209 TaxID=1160137 RepID=UPI0003727D72|nr:hypothetical protein [Nocardia sp. BMG111209]